MKRFVFIIFSLSFLILSCTTPPSATDDGIRTLILDGISVAENETENGFTAWECEDYYNGGPTIVEVGYFEQYGDKWGFVLFDGGYTGTFAKFSRDGVEYRWDWGKEFQYCITIDPSGVGRYYDFTTGKTHKPRFLYNAEKR